MKRILKNPANPLALLLMALTMAFTISCESKEEKQAKAEAAADAALAAEDAAWAVEKAAADAARAARAEAEEASEAEGTPHEIQYGEPLTYKGQRYKTVIIGKQTWMAENLNYKTGNSWCYDNEESNCEKYGRLYDWNTAIKACPSGWHLPSVEEWDNLMIAAGGIKKYQPPEGGGGEYFYYDGAGKKLKSKTGWDVHNTFRNIGTDEFGFSALPGGTGVDGSFSDIGKYGEWWSSTQEGGSDDVYGRRMSYKDDGEDGLRHTYFKSGGLSVRCVQGEASAQQAAAETLISFKIVKIGNQTWMAENLNFKTGNSWCYDKDEANCEKYGRLYDWETAIKACPIGWHLPSQEEWEVLAVAVGGEKVIEDDVGLAYVYLGANGKLKSKTGWSEKAGNGTDDFGFSALPGSSREERGVWWSSTDGFEIGRATSCEISHVVMWLNSSKKVGCSVRCVKD